MRLGEAWWRLRRWLVERAWRLLARSLLVLFYVLPWSARERPWWIVRRFQARACIEETGLFGARVALAARRYARGEWSRPYRRGDCGTVAAPAQHVEAGARVELVLRVHRRVTFAIRRLQVSSLCAPRFAITRICVGSGENALFGPAPAEIFSSHAFAFGLSLPVWRGGETLVVEVRNVSRQKAQFHGVVHVEALDFERWWEEVPT